MKHILIPTDFSENAWNAIEYAIHFFETSPCYFYLLHVNTPTYQSNDALGVFNSTTVSNTHSQNQAKKRLSETIKRINKNVPLNINHKFFTIIDNNFLINSIRKQVEEKKIDFIVMGTKGASDFQKIAIGNNTGNVITRVKCTTLVVPKNAKYVNLKEIAFPTDYSFFYPSETLQPITDIIEGKKAAVRVAHLDKVGIKLNENQQRNKDFLDDYFVGAKHSFHSLTNARIEYAMQEFVESKKVNLITMLAKNLNYFQKILFHPLGAKINYYTDIPFLVLH